MKLQDWKEQSLKRLEKRMQVQVKAPVGTPNFHRHLANLKVVLAARDYEYGTMKVLADTDKASPVYNPYGKSIGRWCVFTENGWELDNGGLK